MCQKLAELHQHVPLIIEEASLSLANGEMRNHPVMNMFKIILGGDQLTATLARSAISIHASHLTALNRLEGLIALLKVIPNKYYSCTLYRKPDNMLCLSAVLLTTKQ